MKYTKGDKVMVIDAGLMALEQFRSKNTRPSYWGWFEEEMDDGSLLIKFPIGDDDPNEHSQVAPYPPNAVKRLEWEWSNKTQ